MRVIKKYSNRRLYDSGRKAYINLEDLTKIIRSGEDVRVADAKSGADLTQATLAQIILESRGASKLLPVPLLTQLIRMEDNALTDFFSNYVTWALEAYRQAKEGLEAISPINPLMNLPIEATKAMARFFGLTGWGAEQAGGHPSPTPTPPPVPEPEDAEESEIAELRREMEELKELLKVGKK